VDKNLELELYKLCCEEDREYKSQFVDEMGWINDKQFCVWVPYLWLREFMERMISIFGYGLFDDGGFEANVQGDGLCIDLCEALESYLEIEDVFPKDKYRH